jgi:hypothetical protein
MALNNEINFQRLFLGDGMDIDSKHGMEHKTFLATNGLCIGYLSDGLGYAH